MNEVTKDEIWKQTEKIRELEQYNEIREIISKHTDISLLSIARTIENLTERKWKND